jgi:CRP-like cAMP-binding protein
MGAEGAAYLLSAGRRVHASVGHSPLGADADSRNVYFPESGLVSVLWTGPDGRIAETAVVGPDGAVGFVEAMGEPAGRTAYRALIAGSGWLVSSAAVKTLVTQDRLVAAQAWRYAGRVLREGHHGCACRAVHPVLARLADSLLNYAERAGAYDRLTLTHEVLSWSLGVCRTTVTTMMKDLIDQGLVTPGRGRVAIADVAGLEVVACGCRRGARESGERRNAHAAVRAPAAPAGRFAFEAVRPQP